ncbi:hypothetical protein [Actinacidiphila yanglinensis]|uniref:hypothetical protein n=1 Tax=Actinacidiphila yanglinensis TaxID=310779 RepID=UPI001F37C487|nr:hypothetical protein [Actinacidiphila yanglinensis]
MNRLDLLEAILDGRGRWAEAVAHEARASAAVALPGLASVFEKGWLGEPLEIGQEEAAAVERVRRSGFFGQAQRPTQHLGEAQTLHIVRTWLGYGDSVWISDDRAACDFARHHGITTWRTMDVMAQGCARGDVVHVEAFALLQAMQSCGRSLEMPSSAQALLS